jgi:ubiquinone/menaquinone biosynthesis C-methylase UbiE
MLLAIASVLVARGADPGAGAHGDDATMHHRFDDVDRWVKVFDDPSRDAWQKPAKVVKHLGLKTGATVVDLGAGTGYFTMHLARAVGARGTVLAVDIEPGLVDHIRERAAAAKLGQVEARLAAPDDPGLPDGAVDLVFVCDTWHHIDGRGRYLERLARALEPGGRIAIVDFREGDLPVGPPAGHKLSREQIVDELARGGFRLASELDKLPYQYVLVFSRSPS